MQIKPKILQGRKSKMAYIIGVENTINPIFYYWLFQVTNNMVQTRGENRLG